MGIILSALGGAAKGLDEANDNYMKQQQTIEAEGRADTRARGMADYTSGLQEQRAKAMEIFKHDQADLMRTQQAGRIDAATGKIADTAVEAKRGIVNSQIADPASWTAEQQGAVDQSLALDRNAAMIDPKTRTQAAVSTGDITPKEAATLADSERRLDSAENTAAARAAAAERESGRKERADQLRYDMDGRRIDSREKIARDHAEALMARKDKGEDIRFSREERLKYTTLYGDAGRQMVEAQKTLRKLQSDFMYSSAAKGSPQALEMDEIRTNVADFRKQRELYGSLLAGTSGDGTGEKPTTRTPAAGSPEANLRKQMEGINNDPDREIADVQRDISGGKLSPKDLAQAKEYLATLKPSQRAPAAPVTVTTAAQRDALPKGTQYTAPNGQTYTKN